MINFRAFRKLFVEEKIFVFIILISIISSLRALFIPLVADEITYNKLAENLLSGRYYLTNYPSTVTPIIPLVFAFFKIKSMPVLGFIMHKLFNLTLTIFTLRYIYLFFEKQKVDKRVVIAILALTMVNPIGIAYFSSLYPEAIVFFCFWGFIYYSTLKFSNKNLLKMLLFFLVLVLTRYVYAVLGLVVLLIYYQYLKEDRKKYSGKIIKYSVLVFIPFLFWAKYIYNIEQSNLSEISYFKRFKVDNPLLYNIKCGLGIIKHHEVDKINGTPAFASLFVPITGFRNIIISLVMLLAFILGYILKEKTSGIKILFLSIILIMVGLVFAGTGFSRYWLVLMPGYFLGFYFLWDKLKLKTIWFIYMAQALSLIYMVNEFRLDIMILSNHL
ncbi:hypothetical protein [Algibacter sp. R77976]|uniref:hypothetical protein n=1 Tax=Algibacter sp. R77976 TaxID=3093873 RepID=UPI0037CCA671